MTMQEMLPFLESLAKGISTQFGTHCEVTVHDMTHGVENTIVAIENGHVTKRQIGDGSSELVLQTLKSNKNKVKDIYSYLARTKEGSIIKSSSIFLRDDEGKVIGLFGINFDVSELMFAQAVINNFTSVADEKSEPMMNITTDVNDLLDQLIEESTNLIGKPVSLMTKDDKIKAIQFLNDKGAFLIKKAGDKISKHYDISKYTLYNYLDAEL